VLPKASSTAPSHGRYDNRRPRVTTLLSITFTLCGGMCRVPLPFKYYGAFNYIGSIDGIRSIVFPIDYSRHNCLKLDNGAGVEGVSVISPVFCPFFRA